MPLGLFVFDKWYLPYIAINISNLLPDYCGFFKDMHDILNEEFAMLPEINIHKYPVRVLWLLCTWEKHGDK